MSLKKYIKESRNEKMMVLARRASSVVENLKQTANELWELQKMWENTSGQRTDFFGRYAMKIEEILSTDHGEAGLEPEVESFENDIATADHGGVEL